MSTSRVPESVIGGLRFQRAAVDAASLASPLYGALLDAALEDIDAGGPCAAVLSQAPAGIEPIQDALTLRFLGAVHRLVLAGQAPTLARWFPSAGGHFDPASDASAAGADFVATVGDHVAALVAGLDLGVQTNEVGRCATLAVGFTELLRRFDLPLALLELGASAGLNLRWDRWRYESGETAWGDESSPLRFVRNYRAPHPAVGASREPAEAVASRRGCDRSPIDPTTDEGRLLLKSFVWPDQDERHARLDAALAVAAEVPASIERSDAAAWLEQVLEPAEGTTTVVYHSVVWQYLPAATRDAVVAALGAAGAAAGPTAPVAWLRMEPGAELSEAAELRLRTWPGGQDQLLALTGYHGHPVWVPPGAATTG